MIFRQYLKLIIFFIIIGFSHNTIAGTESEAYEIRKSCLKAGGSWRQFNNSCANNCSENKFNVCSQILIFACDCGIDSCWNQSKCIKNTEYNQLLTVEPKKEPNKLEKKEIEKKEIEKNKQDGVHTRKKIMFKVIDQSLARAQSIKDITPKSIKKNSQATDNKNPTENNTNTNNSANSENSDFNIFDDSKNKKPAINASNNLKDIYRKIGIIGNDTKEPVNKKDESNITDSIGSIFDDKETVKKESKNDENKTAENSSKEEAKKPSGLLSLLSIDGDKNKDKNKLEIPLPPLFNEEKKNPENKNNESNVIKKSDDKTSKTSEVQ